MDSRGEATFTRLAVYFGDVDFAMHTLEFSDLGFDRRGIGVHGDLNLAGKGLDLQVIESCNGFGDAIFTRDTWE